MRILTRALCAAAVLVLAPAPASAHDSLVASAPEDGQALQWSPEEVVLTFSGRVMDVSTAVVVLDSEAEPVPVTDPLVEGPDVSVELPPDLADGGYAVRWRVVSGDGHPISGAFTFRVGEGGPPPPALDAAPGEESTEDSTRTPVEGFQGSAGNSGDQDTVSSPALAGSLPRTAALALVGALGGVLVHLVVLRLNRAYSNRAHSNGRRPTAPSTMAEKETR